MTSNPPEFINCDKYETRVISVIVCPRGEPTFSELVTRIEIVDEAAGEFIKVTQEGGHTDYGKSIAIEDGDWPVLRGAIDAMVAQCRRGDA